MKMTTLEEKNLERLYALMEKQKALGDLDAYHALEWAVFTLENINNK